MTPWPSWWKMTVVAALAVLFEHVVLGTEGVRWYPRAPTWLVIASGTLALYFDARADARTCRKKEGA